MQLAPRKAGSLRPVHDVLSMESVAERVDGQGLIGVELEDPLDCCGGGFVGRRNAAPVLADVLVPVGCFADEPALLNAASQALFDIERLLLGVETRHVGERSPHHATGGVRVCRLRDRNEREAVLALQSFEFNVVEEVACRAVNFVEQKAIKF